MTIMCIKLLVSTECCYYIITLTAPAGRVLFVLKMTVETSCVSILHNKDKDDSKFVALESVSHFMLQHGNHEALIKNP